MGGYGPPPDHGWKACLQVCSTNVNSMSVLAKRKINVRGRLDVIGVQETRIKSCAVMNYVMGCESQVWEGTKGRVVWCGVDKEINGSGKER